MTKMRHSILKTGLAAMALGIAGNASAVVIYEFEAVILTTPQPGQIAGSFSVTVPDFVQPNSTTNFAPAALNACTVTYPANLVCGTITFSSSDASGLDVIEFRTDESLIFAGYGYDVGTFNTVGIHQASFASGGFQPARLTVINTGGAPLPEPATWGMMLVGFGIIGGAMRRGRVVRPQLV
jgi:PEP-CTERM motif